MAASVDFKARERYIKAVFRRIEEENVREGCPWPQGVCGFLNKIQKAAASGVRGGDPGEQAWSELRGLFLGDPAGQDAEGARRGSRRRYPDRGQTGHSVFASRQERAGAGVHAIRGKGAVSGEGVGSAPLCRGAGNTAASGSMVSCEVPEGDPGPH